MRWIGISRRGDCSASRGTDAWWRVAALLAVGIGVVLRAVQFASTPSIWVDEAALASSIIDRDVRGLLVEPLDYGQLAPPGFLLAVKLCTALFGIGEWSLRLLPFGAGLLSIEAFRRWAGRWLSEPGTAVATLLFALAFPLIVFSANVKPYSTDVLVTVCTLWLAAISIERATVSVGQFALAGIVATFFSNVASFVLAPACALLAWSAWSCVASERRRRLIVIAAWTASMMASVGWNAWLESPTDRQYLRLFWSPGFAPSGWSAFWRWLYDVLRDVFSGNEFLFSGTLRYAAPDVLVALTAIGAASTAWRGRTEWLLLGPIVTTLATAVFGVFPFTGRLILFLIPLWFVLAVRGAEVAGRWLLRSRRGELAALLLAPIAIAAVVGTPFPQPSEELRAVVQYVHAHRRPGDAIWVYYGAGQAFAYYDRLFPLPGATISACDRGAPASQLEQVDALRGRPRAWIVVAHAYPLGAINERALLVSYLDRIGERLATFPPDFRNDADRSTAAAFLYRLDDPDRLAAATAGAFPVPAAGGAAWTCYGSMAMDARSAARGTAALHATMNAGD